MTPESLFSIANTTAALSWLLLAVRPRAAVVQRVTGLAVPLLFAVAYAAIVVSTFGTAEGGFGTLPEVAALFRNPWMLLAGWIHYLAFDLLTGVWETRDAAKRGIPHWMVVPCLFLTFMFGPAGWLLYQGLRRTRS